MRRIAISAFVLVFAVSLPLLAESAPGAPPPGEDPLARFLFPPDRVMAHASEIGLDDAQRSAIRSEVQKAQPKFLDLQFDMQAEMEKFRNVLQEKKVDEARALGELDRLLALEKEIKRTQIGLLVRIKNTLTAAQQSKLEELARPGR